MAKRTIISIVFCVEKGLLEEQAVLLIDSIKRLSDAEKYQLIAFSPREKNQPSEATKSYFRHNQVLHLTENINLKYQDYPIANKVLACAYVEKNIETENSILFVDTDTVFINNISNEYIESEGCVYVRPVDNKGPGSEGLEDLNDQFWQEAYQLFNIDAPDSNMLTTVRKEKIRNYFNAGFIWSHKVNGFFKQWYSDFETLVESGLRPYGYQSRDDTNFRCLDQVALSVTTTKFESVTKIISPLYNYPIPFKPILDKNSGNREFQNLVHIHYHKWFQHPQFLGHVCSELEKKSPAYNWLKSRLPIKPIITGDFKC